MKKYLEALLYLFFPEEKEPFTWGEIALYYGILLFVVAVLVMAGWK